MKKRLNHMRVGLLLGLLVPVLSFVIMYFLGFRGMSLAEFIEVLASRNKLSSVISLSVIPNLLLFFIFIWLNYLYSARGVLASTLLFAGIVLVTKFLI